tara:strand:- start:53963 stop:54346 length:384 start_codon:yes stop_codon:yes gene_type:complete
MNIKSSSSHLEVGDLVTRTDNGALGDCFKCHEYSFGHVAGFVEENSETRPDAAKKFNMDSWEEIVVLPFDQKMAPLADAPFIQWGYEECVRISKLGYWVRILLWPLALMRFNRPLDGRITDRKRDKQ